MYKQNKSPRWLPVFLCVTILQISVSALEQNFGIRGGGNFGQMWRGTEPTDGKLNFNIGAMYRVKFLSVLGAQMEISYNQVSALETTNTRLSSDSLRISTLNYNFSGLDVPVLIKIIAPGFGEVDPHIQLGGFYRYSLNQEATESSSLQIGTTVSPQPGKELKLEGYKNHRYGILVGLGIDFQLGSFDIRYQLSAIELAKAPYDLREGWVSANIAYIFRSRVF